MIFGKNIGIFQFIHLVWVKIKHMVSSFSENESVTYNHHDLQSIWGIFDQTLTSTSR